MNKYSKHEYIRNRFSNISNHFIIRFIQVFWVADN
jgi:hypothetical protein